MVVLVRYFVVLGLVMANWLFGSLPVMAQAARALPQNRHDIQMSFAPIVQRVAAAVVNVYGVRMVSSPMAGIMGDPLFRRFFEGQGNLGARRAQSSLGSGVVVGQDGFVVTNHHVIASADEVRVVLADGREFAADIVLRDERTDLAILKLNGADSFAAMPLGDSDQTQVGDLVLAIGNPFGVGQTVTSGIVSALARTQVGISDYQFFIQTDAAINPGNSGGALVDMKGHLIGINTAIFSRSGGSVGIGFAIPVSMVRGVIESARKGARVVQWPWFGARLQKVTADLTESLNLSRPFGALVSGVLKNSPAMQAGLKVGDVILSVDGHEVSDPDAFGFRYATRMVGGVAQLDVSRAGRRLALSVPLVSAPFHEATVYQPPRTTPFAGASLMDLTPFLSEELRLEGMDEGGVVVSDLKNETPAQALGLQRGDVIRAINGRRVARILDMQPKLDAGARFWRITIQRGAQLITVVIGG